jgi:hypothetical protein
VRLVLGEQPLVAERRAYRQERLLERRERGGGGPPRDARPAGEPLGRCRAEDSEIAARELAAGIGRLDRRRGDRPDARRARTVPADRDAARRRGVPQRVGVDSERAAGLAVGRARRSGGRAAAPPSARRVRGSCRLPGAGRARTARSRVRVRRRCGSAGPTAARATDAPTSTAPHPRPAHAARAARRAACCPASPPTPRAGANRLPCAFARRGRRRDAGTRESAAS